MIQPLLEARKKKCTKFRWFFWSMGELGILLSRFTDLYVDRHWFSTKSNSIKGRPQLSKKMGHFQWVFEYETPKVITIQNVRLGILRLLLQSACISFIVFYQLWISRGYQDVYLLQESSTFCKVKGSST